MSEFFADLAAYLLKCGSQFHSDGLRSLYPYTKSSDVLGEGNRPWLNRSVRKTLARYGFYRRSDAELEAISGRLREVARRDQGLETTYGLLADEHSHRTLIEVMAYRILGPSQVILGRNNADYGRKYDLSATLVEARQTAKIGVLDGYLDRYRLAEIGFPITAELHRLNILYTFLLQQYRYDREGVVIEAREKDVAIDGGGCWGDTALYLAHLVGPKGRVFTFEFSADNLPILRRNLAANASLAEHIQVEQFALWESAGETLRFSPHGPATQVGTLGEESVETLSIDALASREQLSHVDFIKMDIEGAERPALRGAVETISAHRPRLAVTLYHSLDDFARIPAFLDEMQLGYRFYLDHFSIKTEETVMFAVAE